MNRRGNTIVLRMHGDLLLDHFRNPRNAGELPPPAIVVEVFNPACGDILKLSARFDAGRVAQAAFQSRGCTASIAGGSALTELILGRTSTELHQLSKSDVERALGGLPPESKHVATLCIDAIKALLIHTD